MPDDLHFTTAPFLSGETIPREYTCEGADVSPELEWAGAPTDTETFAIIVDDPDAPGQTFTHWVLFNIPGTATSVPQELDVETHFGDADPIPAEGKNDFGDVQYGGPCPPPGDGPHRYVFRLFALGSVLSLNAGASKEQVQNAMDGHVLDDTQLIGTYER